MISKAYQQGQTVHGASLRQSWIKPIQRGLSPFRAAFGDIGKALLSDKLLADNRLQWWKDLFVDRFYLDLQRLSRPDDDRYVYAAVTLAEQTNTPVVATNICCFLHRDDFEAHEVRVCINEGRALDDPRRPRVILINNT